MMILQVVSKDLEILEAVAKLLLSQKLIGNAMMSDPIVMTSVNEDGSLITEKQHKLQGISKSLLFNEINMLLRSKYNDRMPLLYSEPLILIDPEQRDHFMDVLSKVEFD